MPKDSFGLNYIYPTKSGGETWEMNNNNFNSDPRHSGDDAEDNGTSWTWSGSGIRSGIATSSGFDDGACETDHQVCLERGYMQDANDWRNFEFGGYAIVADSADDEMVLYGRGGRHTGDGNPDGCKGSAYKCDIDMNSGDIRFAKESWHVSYEFSEWHTGVNDVNAWFGWKLMIYNSQDNKSAIMECWIDQGAGENNYQMMFRHTDSGDWSSAGG